MRTRLTSYKSRTVFCKSIKKIDTIKEKTWGKHYFPHSVHFRSASDRNSEPLLLSGFFVQLVRHQNAAAIFADDDFLAHPDVELPLGRNAVVASSAGVALDRHHGQPVADIPSYSLISRQKPGVDLRLSRIRLLRQAFHLLGRLLIDSLELLLFGSQIDLAVGNDGLSILDHFLLDLDIGGVFLDFLLAQFDLEFLILDFFRQRVELAVVSDVILLLFVFGYQNLGLLDLLLALLGRGSQPLHFGSDIGHTGLQTGDLVLEVLNLQREALP